MRPRDAAFPDGVARTRRVHLNCMHRIPAFSFLLFAFPALIGLVFVSPLSAQDKGYWRADSSTAKSITGDLGLSDAKLIMNFLSFPLAQIRKLTPAEGLAAFDVDASTGVGGNLYRLDVSASRRFLHKNTLCGTEETQWMATYVAGRSLYVDFFSGTEMPKLTFDALQNSTELCGTFVYAR